MGFDNGTILVASIHARSTNGQDIVNTLHYNYSAGILDRTDSDSIAQALADRLKTDLAAPFRALFSSSWTMQPVVVSEERDPLHPDRVRSQREATPSPAGGSRTVATDLLPTACCRVYTTRTALVGRSFRGRLFVGGSPLEADQGAALNEWDAPTGSNFAMLANTYVAAIPMAPDLVWGSTTASVKWCVYSPTRRARGESDYANDIIGTTARTPVHWLRSRMPGR